MRTLGEWEVTARYGKMWFMYDDSWRDELQRLEADARPHRVLFIVRPGELDVPAPVVTLRRPDGTPVLWISERQW